jgi:nicotinate phosphoribosyltransferase
MSADIPVLDMADKIVSYAGRPVLKLSERKATVVGAKQVWRAYGAGGRIREDRICARDEPSPGADWEPLLERVVRGGAPSRAPSLAALRTRHGEEIRALAPELLDLHPSAHYLVSRSKTLLERQQEAIETVRRREGL